MTPHQLLSEKGRPVFSVKKSEEFSETMSDVWANQAEIGKASVRAFTFMYGGKDDDTLKKLRYVQLLLFVCHA